MLSCNYSLYIYIYIYKRLEASDNQGVDVVEWSRALDVRLSEWCCSVTMVWVQIPSREEFNTSLNENVIQRSVEFFITLFCVLIVSLYRNDPTPCKIDR